MADLKRKLQTAGLLLLATLPGCQRESITLTSDLQSVIDDPISCNSKKFTAKDLHLAALEVIYPLVLHFDVATPEKLRQARAKTAEIRMWAATIPNPRIQAEYLNWIEFYESKYSGMEAALTDNRENEYQQREREREEESARASELAACLPKPGLK